MLPTMSLSQEQISSEFKLDGKPPEQRVHLVRQHLQIITVINTELGQVGGMQFLFGQGHKIETFCDF